METDERTDAGEQARAEGEAPRMRVVFMGTPAFALGSLGALLRADFVDVVAVVTRPDAVSGRGKALVPSPVKTMALEAGVPVIETKTLRDEDVQDRLRELAPDLIAVTAYGAIIPDEVRMIPPMGCVNVHASLLPRWRGAAPMQRAILAGDPYVGFSIMRIGHELDAGPWVTQRCVATGERTYPEISAELSRMGGEELVDVLRAWWVDGEKPDWMVQDPERATYADKIDKAELRLDPGVDALTNRRRVQASSDEAPARCLLAGRGVRVMRAHLVTDEGDLPDVPAGAVRAAQGRLLLGCADGVLEVLELKPDGKRAMDAREFVIGLQDHKGLTWEALV